MAQYIPKTAWRVSNLSKRYGSANVHSPSYFPSRHVSPTSVLSVEAGNSKQYDAAALLERYNERRVSFLDVRDAVEQRVEPLRSAVPLHLHDILSGAAKYVLPTQKEAEVVVVVSGAVGSQRGANAFHALRRWGYENITVADYGALKAAGCE